MKSYLYLPLVEFEYPSSETGNLLLRLVRVTQRTELHVEGYEWINPTDGRGKPIFRFKKYSLSKIANKSIHLVEWLRIYPRFLA